MSIPTTYRLSDSCQNCKHCHVYPNFSYTEFWCIKDGSQHPAKNENGDITPSIDLSDDLMDKSLEWEGNHSVQPFGVCEEWEIRE